MDGQRPDARFEQEVHDHLQVVSGLLDEGLRGRIALVAGLVVDAYRSGSKLLIFGNGGSAADAQHLAAEFLGRFERERPALPALALTESSAVLTAVSNDYGYARVFARQVEALGTSGDVALGLSTSGRSESVVEGLRAARQRGLHAVAVTGRAPGPVGGAAELCLCLPSESTARVQEATMLVGHILAGAVERRLADERRRPGATHAGRD